MPLISGSGINIGQASSSTAVDKCKAAVPLNTSNQGRRINRLTQVTHLRATVLQASQQVVAKGHDIDRLVGGSAVQDGYVLVIAIQLQDGQAAIHQLLKAILIGHDVDLRRLASNLAQCPTSGLRHHQVFGASLSIDLIDCLIKFIQVERNIGGAVTDHLRVGGVVCSRQALGQAIKCSRAGIRVALNKQGLERQAHGTGLGLNLIGTGLRALQINDSAVDTNVTTEQTQCLAMLLNRGIALGIASVEVTEPNVAEGLLPLPEQAITLNFTERQILEQRTGSEFGNDRCFLRVRGVLFGLCKS